MPNQPAGSITLKLDAPLNWEDFTFEVIHGQNSLVIKIERTEPSKKARTDKWVDAGEA